MIHEIQSIKDENGVGYKVAWKLLRAQFLEVAQKRERLIIIAVRDDLDAPILFPREDRPLTTVWEALDGVPDSVGVSYSDSAGGRTTMAARLSWDEPSYTIMCSPAQKQTERCHPGETRPLTVRESARLQSFPDEWQFFGSVANQYKQVGNAVPVNLAYHLGRAATAIITGVDRGSFDVMPALAPALES